jgi:hypothetical protein
MVGFIIAFCFFLLCALCIATLIRGWKAYSVIVVLVPTFAILIPFAPSNTAVLVWYFTVTAPLAVMIYYGERGRESFEKFMAGLGGQGESLIERFKKWNQ